MRQPTGETFGPREGVGPQPALVDPDGYANRLVRHWARRLVRELRLPATDLADVEQELWLDLVIRWPGYDARRASPKTFAARIVESRAATLRENMRKSARRRARQIPSETGDGCDDPSDGDVRSKQGHWPAQDVRGLTAPEGDRALADDLDSVLSRLPDSLRDLCRRLMIEDVSGVARQTGLSRAAIYRRIKIARARFVAAEVHEYL